MGGGRLQGQLVGRHQRVLVLGHQIVGKPFGVQRVRLDQLIVGGTRRFGALEVVFRRKVDHGLVAGPVGQLVVALAIALVRFAALRVAAAQRARAEEIVQRAAVHAVAHRVAELDLHLDLAALALLALVMRRFGALPGAGLFGRLGRCELGGGQLRCRIRCCAAVVRHDGRVEAAGLLGHFVVWLAQRIVDRGAFIQRLHAGRMALCRRRHRNGDVSTHTARLHLLHVQLARIAAVRRMIGAEREATQNVILGDGGKAHGATRRMLRDFLDLRHNCLGQRQNALARLRVRRPISIAVLQVRVARRKVLTLPGHAARVHAIVIVVVVSVAMRPLALAAEKQAGAEVLRARVLQDTSPRHVAGQRKQGVRIGIARRGRRRLVLDGHSLEFSLSSRARSVECGANVAEGFNAYVSTIDLIS